MGENGKVQLCIGAGRRTKKKCGGVEVALVVRSVADVRLR